MSTFSWPSTTGGSSSNASIGPTGSTAPDSATEVAGVNPSGNLIPLQLDANNNLLVAFGSTAEPIPVSQSGVWNITNITGTVSLPTGAATSALQSTGNTTLSTISTTLGSILLDLTNGTQITQITGTVPLPTGSATAANQTTMITDLASILANQTNGTQTTALLAGTATIGSILNITGTVSLPTGASTSALQTTGNTSLASIVTNTTGLATSAAQTTAQTSLTAIQTSTGLGATANQQTNGLQKSQIATPTALTVTNAAITVGATAVRLTVNGSTPAATRVVLVATPDSATLTTVTFYIGASTVTNSGATRGIQIQVGQPFIANNDAGDYWICASAASQTVTVMEQA